MKPEGINTTSPNVSIIQDAGPSEYVNNKCATTLAEWK